MRLRTLLWRSFRLRCPYCGQGKLFRHWLKMHTACPHCEASFEREDGYYLGSIYINYGITSVILAATYPILLFGTSLTNNQTMLIAGTFVFTFPIWFFRYARSFWIGFDEYFDPRKDQ